MGRKEFINFFFGVIFSVLICWVSLIGVYSFKDSKKGTSADVKTTKEKVVRYLKNEYSKYSNVTVSSGTETKVNCNNHNQTTLRNYFNNNNGTRTDISDGICWASATTSLLEFNKATKKSASRICFDVIDVAEKNLYVLYDSNGEALSGDGFTQDEQDDLLTKMFEKYSVKKKGNNDYFDIYDTLVDEIDNGRAVIFSIDGHTMTGSGYVTYTVKYSKKNIFGKTVSKREKKRFVIVNDTWAENLDRQYSYFPEDSIGTSITNRWNFGITKVRNK